MSERPCSKRGDLKSKSPEVQLGRHILGMRSSLQWWLREQPGCKGVGGRLRQTLGVPAIDLDFILAVRKSFNANSDITKSHLIKLCEGLPLGVQMETGS